MEVGEVVAGKYQVERLLGSGGMGMVVAAKHLQLGERVAIKVLLPHALERPEVVQRFLREGRAAARIRSEHVARVYDVGTHANVPYLVMEYLDGQDLGALIRGAGPQRVETAIEYVLQACEALAEAHAMGIVHRDLKPGNLFLAKRMDGSPQIKVIDFGISKVAGGEGDGEMTATAVMMGSPLYMAPEQMASARDVDVRADIWSMGVILYSLLTGGPPFKASSVMAVYELVLRGAPDVRASRPDVPEALAAAIHRCLQKDREHRFQTIADLVDAIVPFGPAHGQISAMRISRVIRGGAPPTARAMETKTPALSSTPPPALGVTPPTASPTPAPAPKVEAQIEIPTGGSWGQTHSPSRRRSRLPMIAAIVLALGAGGSLAFVMVYRHGGQPLTAESATPSVGVDPPHTPATEAAPTPPATDTPAVTATPTASVAVTPGASASAAVSSPKKRPIGGPGRPGQTGRPDLFNDPH